MNNQYGQIIIGAGFAGICAAIKLKEAGMDNFVILERNGHLGGTWYDNAYPGAACDVQSHLYSFSFERNPDWSMEFSPQEEILHYMEHCAEKYGVTQYIQYSKNVIKSVFDEANAQWQVSTGDGTSYSGKALICCSGGLSQPAIPEFAGMDSFKGKMFHTARWDKNFDPKGKTIAVVGTGASAIQVVPALAPDVKQLHLFQRTPAWVMPKPDKRLSSFRRAVYRKIPFTGALQRSWLYWTHEFAAVGFTKRPGLLKFFSKLALLNLKREVPDDALRKKVTPNYVMGCKRILLSNDYYPALQRKNVEVITDSIQRFTEKGIVTNDGKERSVDAIVFATGFHAADGKMVFDVKGRNGLDLTEAWKNGAEAYYGVTVSGFPNLFLVVGPNTGLGHTSMIVMIEAQVHYIVEALKNMRAANARFIDLKKDVLKSFNEDLQAKLAKTVWQSGGCHSWYQNESGKNVALWPGFTFTFVKRTKKFEADKYELVK